MSNKVLKLKDGFSGTSPELRGDVKRLQLALKKAGHSVDADGLFGKGTQDAVKAFQRDHGLSADGIVGANTWAALPSVEGMKEPEAAHADSSLLTGFRGDLSWVHAREGHAGKTYWPGGASGVTLDPGVDLGHAKASLIEEAYKALLTPEQSAAVKKVLGIKGDAAKAALGADPVLQSIRISRSQADTIFQFAAQPYWNAIVRRFPSLTESDTLPSVQTVMLSLAYNRGARNRGLEELKQPIAAKNWSKVAELIGSMQQDHKLAGIRKRRRMEADLIRQELA